MVGFCCCVAEVVEVRDDDDVVGVKERMVMGEEGGPHGVVVVETGREARGWKGGEGRVERPVPPIIAMGTGSGRVVSAGRDM